MISLKSLRIGIKARDLRGMPRFRFVGGAGEWRKSMVRSIGGDEYFGLPNLSSRFLSLCFVIFVDTHVHVCACVSFVYVNTVL